MKSKRGRPQKVTDEEILSAMERLGERGLYVIQNLGLGCKISPRGLSRRLRALELAGKVSGWQQWPGTYKLWKVVAP